MNLGQLRSYIRANFLKDNVAPYRWDNATLNASINEAQLEAVWRKALIVETSIPGGLQGSAVSRVTIVTGVAAYLLDPSVIFLRKVQLGLNPIPLGSTDYRAMDQSYHGWDSQTGAVERFITGYDASGSLKLRLFRIPISDDVAYLTVVRAPATLVNDTDTPEINERYHLKLCDWVCYRAYATRDPDREDPELSEMHQKRFVEYFGTREQAEAEEAQRVVTNRFAYMDGTY